MNFSMSVHRLEIPNATRCSGCSVLQPVPDCCSRQLKGRRLSQDASYTACLAARAKSKAVPDKQLKHLGVAKNCSHV
jgi:hypothetical protein